MSNRNYVKDTNYLQIQGWMVSRLGLKGNSLLIYAIIYGFSQDGHNMFKGTMNYLAQWTCSSKESVRQTLNKLCDAELIIKQVEYINNVKFVYYRTNMEKVGGYTTLLTNVSNKVVEGIQESWVINNINNNISDSIIEKKSREITDLTIEELEQLKQLVLENRDTQKITYREIQKKFNLIDPVTFDTPTLCNKLIKQVKDTIRRINSTERCTGFSGEIF
mgnify:CR=1 FL=1